MKTHFEFPPKRILVPVDFSAGSVMAWRGAKSLGASVGASVTGLFVHDWVIYPELVPSPLDIDSALADLRRRLGAGKDDIRGVAGSPAGTIVAWGRELDYDLIVMGTHGRTGMERLLLGSVAESVIRASPVPVLVVRRPLGRVRVVLAPVNFQPYSQDGLIRAAEVASVLGARLQVLHAVDAPIYGAEALKGPRHLLADAVNKIPESLRKACKPKTRIAFGAPAEQIAAAGRLADLVVVAAHRKGFLNETLLGTTCERLVRHCPAPVLALPPRQKENKR